MMEGLDRAPSRSLDGKGAALKPSEVLAKAAELIEPEGRWTQGFFAKNADGEPIYETDEGAVCFCAIGAVSFAAGWDSYGSLQRAMSTLQRAVGDIPDFNDAPGRTQAEVVAALRKAAELAKSEGQ